MSEEQPEQPRYVTQDQHRADMAELRLELANSLASLDKRTELIAQDLMALRREVTERFEQAERQAAARSSRRDEQIADLRQEMAGIRQEMQTSRAESRQDMLTFRQEMDRFRNTTTRQLWVMVGIMSSAIIGTLIKLLFFPSP